MPPPSPPPGPAAPGRAAPGPWDRAEDRFDFHVERRPRATYVLLGALVAIHLAVGALGPARFAWWFRLFGPRAEGRMLRWGARGGAEVADGELWRFVSYGFLHWDVIHLLVNGLALYGLGRLAEVVYGPVRFYWLFVVSVVGGGLLSQTAGVGVVSAGASGGLFGLFGALVTFGLARRAKMGPSLADLFVRRLAPWLVLNLAVGLLLPVLYQGVTGLLAMAYVHVVPALGTLARGLPARVDFGAGPSLDNRAHIGGLLAGALCALLLGDRITDNHAPRAAATVAMALTMTVVLTWAAGMVGARF
ncbi:MAG: rhomboid family intramembrane serine protease [Pseudomonadota bacterium]|nr:rhomboid family intramembrane serine protease [Pseudomonadota bacterium]